MASKHDHTHTFDVSHERLLAEVRDLRNKIFDARHVNELRSDALTLRLNNDSQARILERWLDLRVEALTAFIRTNGGSNGDKT